MSLEALTTEALAAIAAAEDLATLDQVRVQFTGKKSQLAEQSKALGKMDPEERKNFGAQIHAVREAIWRKNLQVKRWILLYRVVVKRLVVFTPLLKCKSVFVSSLPKRAL